MTSRTLSLSNTLPKINSVTKTDAPSMRMSAKAPTKVVTSKSKTSVKTGIVVNFGLLPVINTLVLATLIFAGGFYIFMINSYASKGYDLKKQGTKVSQLEEQKKQLSVKQAELASIVRVNDVAQLSGMVPIVNQEYINSNQLTQR